ncbi:hypothetical protein ABZV52_21835 [Streptomyces sp. NPDC004735]|uniref:hypothetical protein n=1 Tax=Streptomyces sp. NPDC004735 TaxID=3156654 RepID=UPI0033A99E7A
MEEDEGLSPDELRFKERFDELLATPAGRDPIYALFSNVVKLAQNLDFVWAADGQPTLIIEAKSASERACKQLWRAAWGLRNAKTSSERRKYVREFLGALAESIAQLLQMLARVLLVLLSRLLGRTGTFDMLAWKPVPLDSAPQITPRGPDHAFPVNIYGGGHYRSALGSVVLAA